MDEEAPESREEDTGMREQAQGERWETVLDALNAAQDAIRDLADHEWDCRLKRFGSERCTCKFGPWLRRIQAGIEAVRLARPDAPTVAQDAGEWRVEPDTANPRLAWLWPSPTSGHRMDKETAEIVAAYGNQQAAALRGTEQERDEEKRLHERVLLRAGEWAAKAGLAVARAEAAEQERDEANALITREQAALGEEARNE